MVKIPQRFPEKVQRLLSHLQRVAEPSDLAAQSLDLDQMLDVWVNLIHDQLQCYYVGLFLVDDSRQSVRLRAGTGEWTQHMINRHPRKIDDCNSMEGWVTHNRQARIVLGIGRDPLLPQTRSRIALPLIAKEQVIGVLDIQSAEEAAFFKEDVLLLQSVANQLAKALHSVRI